MDLTFLLFIIPFAAIFITAVVFIIKGFVNASKHVSGVVRAVKLGMQNAKEVDESSCKCEYCGTKQPKDKTKCESCGAKLSN